MLLTSKGIEVYEYILINCDTRDIEFSNSIVVANGYVLVTNLDAYAQNHDCCFLSTVL